MTTRPLWLDPHADGGPLDGDTTADICVVGEASAAPPPRAWREPALTSPGWRPTASPTARPAATASSCKAPPSGMAAVGLMGRSARDASTDGASRTTSGWQPPSPRTRSTVAGSLQLAGSEREEAELIASHDLLRADGFDARSCRGRRWDALRRRGFGSAWCCHATEAHPAAFVGRGLGGTSGRLYEQTRVTTIDAWSLARRSSTRNASCAVVVVCVNAWVGRLLPWFADKVDPVRGQMLATAPASAFDRPIMPTTA